MCSSVKSTIVSAVSSAVVTFAEYDTPKIVHIQSKKVGLINRLLQAAIFVYIAV